MIISFILGVIVGAVACYFFLRNNPQKAAQVNSAVNQVKNVIPGK